MSSPVRLRIHNVFSHAPIYPSDCSKSCDHNFFYIVLVNLFETLQVFLSRSENFNENWL